MCLSWRVLVWGWRFVLQRLGFLVQSFLELLGEHCCLPLVSSRVIVLFTGRSVM